MGDRRAETRTGGRPPSGGVIAGDFALSVGRPDKIAPAGWSWTSLCQVARLETGHTPSRKHPEYWGGDVPWIGIKDATENHGRVISDTYQHTNKLGIANSSARILPANTVCLSRTASVGYVIVMGKPMATSQDFVNWVCSDAINHKFLKYVLLAERFAFLRFASGTTHQTIYFPEVKAFHVCLPPISEQRAIARILGALDDKIELNRRMNETLEAIAQALFRTLFVDFEPDRAEAGGRAPGLPELLVEIFPLPRIADVQDVPFEEVIDFKEGPGIMASDFRTSGVPLIRLAGLEPGASVLNGCNFLDPNAVRERWSHFRLDVGDVLLSTSASLGRVAIVSEEGAGAIPYTGIIRMRPRNDQVLPEMIGYMLKSVHFQTQVEAVGAGSVLRHFGPTHLRQMTVRVGPIGVQREFVRLMTPVWSKIRANREESSTLTALRNALLPKLISGEVRVNADRFMERLA